MEALAHPETATRDRKRMAEIQDHAETYYERFGLGWAFANFSRKIENGELGSLLGEAQENHGGKQAFLTRFLKKATKVGQQVGKLSWINDVVGENNFARAEESLTEVAEVEEMDLYSKKTELSLAKLANLAAIEQTGTPHRVSPVPDSANKYDNKIELIEIQERLYQHVVMVIGPTIDEKAAEELALSTFAARVVNKSTGLKRLLKSAISALLAGQPLSVEALVDIISLADPVNYEEEPEDDPGILGNEFQLALHIVGLSDLPYVHKLALRQLIWRRAMIRDDWTVLNETKGRDDFAVQEAMQASAIFRTLLPIAMDAQSGSASIDLTNQIVSPTEILDMENVFPLVLQQRFEGADKEREQVRKDLEKEQATLRKYVDKAQLDMHWSGLVESARTAVKEALDAQGEDMAAAEEEGEV